DDIVDDGRVLVDVDGLRMGHPVAVDVPVAEAVVRHEGVARGGESETEPDADGVAVPCETDGGGPSCARGQRGPADVTAVVAPRDPARSPHRSRDPAPAEARIRGPAAVVERSPAPTVLGVPVPAVI